MVFKEQHQHGDIRLSFTDHIGTQLDRAGPVGSCQVTVMHGSRSAGAVLFFSCHKPELLHYVELSYTLWPFCQKQPIQNHEVATQHEQIKMLQSGSDP